MSFFSFSVKLLIMTYCVAGDCESGCIVGIICLSMHEVEYCTDSCFKEGIVKRFAFNFVVCLILEFILLIFSLAYWIL